MAFQYGFSCALSQHIIQKEHFSESKQIQKIIKQCIVYIFNNIICHSTCWHLRMYFNLWLLI